MFFAFSVFHSYKARNKRRDIWLCSNFNLEKFKPNFISKYYILAQGYVRKIAI
jgi:hypothetical protein